MTSSKQNAANRKNARSSTGPRSTKGKAIAARNAMKHGLRAEMTVIIPQVEDAAAWEAHLELTLESLQPVGHFELLLAERIAAQSWRLARATRFETMMIETCQEKIEDDLNQIGLLFGDYRIGDTHPEDIRSRHQQAKSTLRSFKRLQTMTDGSSLRSADAAGLVWAACEVIQCESDLTLPDVPQDTEVWELAELDSFTAGQVREILTEVARVGRIEYEDLLMEIGHHLHLEMIQAQLRIEQVEKEVNRERRNRLLPILNLSHEKLQRYENSLERSLYRTLHELQRLQEMRGGGYVPTPLVVDTE